MISSKSLKVYKKYPIIWTKSLSENKTLTLKYTTISTKKKQKRMVRGKGGVANFALTYPQVAIPIILQKCPPNLCQIPILHRPPSEKRCLSTELCQQKCASYNLCQKRLPA